MRTLLTLVTIIFSASVPADPHYVQALHPYSDYGSYLKTFDEPFSIVTDHVNLDGDGDSPIKGNMYIYVYRINQKSIGKFTLDISCKIGTANLILEMPDAIVTNDELSWALNPQEQKKAVLVYSTSPPTQRSYHFNNGPDNKSETLGPSCAETMDN